VTIRQFPQQCTAASEATWLNSGKPSTRVHAAGTPRPGVNLMNYRTRTPKFKTLVCNAGDTTTDARRASSQSQYGDIVLSMEVL
jgi:hypothetical protein